ncbi:MAG: hypothetical protein AB1714_08835 [Acidobacteriota bacterium]
MTGELLLYASAAIITLWGIAHIVPTRSVITGFGALSADNRRILQMEWIAEGLTLCFVGSLVGLLTVSGGTGNQVGLVVYRACAVMLLVLAALSLFTGARAAILPMRICPAVKTVAAILILVGSSL